MILFLQNKSDWVNLVAKKKQTGWNNIKREANVLQDSSNFERIDSSVWCLFQNICILSVEDVSKGYLQVPGQN